MADNTRIRTVQPADAATNELVTDYTVATDDVGGVAFQRVKLDIGGDGVSLPVTDLATSAKQDLLLTELQGKADLTETQPVSLKMESATGTLGALNAFVELDCGTCSHGTLVFEVTGTWKGKIVVEGAIDGTYNNLSIVQPAGAISFAGINNDNQNGVYRALLIAGYTHVRLRMSSYTSGTASVIMNAAQLVPTTFAWQLNAANLQTTTTWTTANDAQVGALTETAPNTDTASSGLNGRLQRIAQRLSSIVALLPTALGAGGGLKIDGSGTALPISGTVTATVDTSALATSAKQDTTNTQIGIVTETAPSTDTASSGLNGRLQRIAQRITSMITALTDGTQKSQVVGPDGSALEVYTRTQTPTPKVIGVQIGPGDIISNIPVVMQYDHHQIHEGESTRFQDVQVSLSTSTVKYGLTVPTYAVTIRAPHLIITCDVYNGTVLVQMYESATFTNGSAVTGYNRNRNSNTTPGLTIATGVTSTNGTLIDSFYVGSGSRSAASNRASVEWVLKSNTIYRVDVIGQVAGTAAIIGFDSYEDLGV